jgi:hypothetical protein
MTSTLAEHSRTLDKGGEVKIGTLLCHSLCRIGEFVVGNGELDVYEINMNRSQNFIFEKVNGVFVVYRFAYVRQIMTFLELSKNDLERPGNMYGKRDRTKGVCKGRIGSTVFPAQKLWIEVLARVQGCLPT